MPSSPSECWTALWIMTFGSLIRSVCPPGRATVFRMPPGSAGVPVSAISTCWKNMIISVSGISSGGGDIST